ncbi:thioredoxin family protein [Flavobacteriaceae bacterium]|jgi:thioredoxin-related protein|nr:thioredoxin family protein [Flavobacteriaceae bacterium]|tara:strand:+ start:460 stop:885 length:426 start_codon:yes stop_codon:yes gene_type:complete
MKIIYVFLFLLSFSLTAQNWETDWKVATQKSKKNNQKLILVFSGSDWCIPCIKLEKEIWEAESFKAYALENYVLLRADFPKRKKNALSKEKQTHNDKLAERFNAAGYFPLVVVISPEEKVLGQLGYEKSTPEKYIELINAF